MRRTPALARPRAAAAVARGFTLLELLVVVSIIVLLVGLLLPALTRARDRARALGCLERLRTLGHVTMLYADDHASLMPRSQHSYLSEGGQPWEYAFHEYLRGRPYAGGDAAWRDLVDASYRCPFDPRRPASEGGPDVPSYGLNVWYELTPAETGGPSWRRFDAPRNPAATVLFGELKATSVTDHAMAHFWVRYDATPKIARDRHGPGLGSGYVFLDGHAVERRFVETFDQAEDEDDWNPRTAD